MRQTGKDFNAKPQKRQGAQFGTRTIYSERNCVADQSQQCRIS
jgi:hypothetical protein